MPPIVSVRVGLTLKILKEGKDTYQFIRPEIEIAGIDCEKNVKKQLQMAEQVAHTTWSSVSDLLEAEINSELGFSKDAAVKEEGNAK